MTQTNETKTENAPVQLKKCTDDKQAAHFTVHPGVKAIIIPMWMIEKIHIDLYTAPQELVVQLVEEGSVEGKEDEAD